MLLLRLHPAALSACLLASTSLVAATTTTTTTTTSSSSSNPLAIRQQCSAGYERCDAEGSTGSAPPGVGDDGLRDLFADVVESVNAAGAATRVRRRGIADDDSGSSDKNNHIWRQRRDDEPELCCKADAGLECLLLQGLRLSFCWDRFRTNYQFADGSWGSLTTGVFHHAATGDTVNLLAGNYTLADDTTTGSIYGGDGDGGEGASPPDTRTMDVPTPWTSEGVGTAIPGDELGGGQPSPPPTPPTTTTMAGEGDGDAANNGATVTATVTETETATGAADRPTGLPAAVSAGKGVGCWVVLLFLLSVVYIQLGG